MKRLIVASFLIATFTTVQSQSRKHSSNFPALQQYYNPAFTGFNGSMIKSYYRNQWAGFDGAPKTLFISGEIDLDEYRRSAAVEGEVPVTSGIHHGVGLSILRDTYGPFVENQIFASYRSKVNLTEKIRLQAGAALAYHAQTLDGNKLSSEEAKDPSLQQFMNQTNRSGRVDFNLGVALSGDDFYAGYALQNIKGGLEGSNSDFFRNNSKVHSVIQAGYRRSVSDKVGVVVNGLFRADNQLKETIEGQVKGVFYNTAWVGAGYRNSLAYSLTVGFRMNQLKVGYAYEIPTGDAHMTGAGTNEILVTYDLRKAIHPKLTRKMSIW